MTKRNDSVLIYPLLSTDRPVTPLNFTGYSYNDGYINLTWVSGFNGGSELFFIISKRNDVEWEMVANITDNGKDKVIYIETGPFSPGQDIWYRLKSCNKINCSIQSTEIKVHVKGILFFLCLQYKQYISKLVLSMCTFSFSLIMLLGFFSMKAN